MNIRRIFTGYRFEYRNRIAQGFTLVELLAQPSQLGGKNGVFVQPGAKVCTINQDFFVLFSSL